MQKCTERVFVYEAGIWDRTDSLGKWATDQKVGFSATVSATGKNLSVAPRYDSDCKIITKTWVFF